MLWGRGVWGPLLASPLVQSLKDHVQVFNMLTCGLTVHQNVIQVHSNVLIEHIREHIMHQALERGRSVHQT